MKALGISLFLIVFSYLGIHAQHLHNDFCGSHTYIDVLDSLYPGLKKQVDNNYLTAVRNSKNDLL